MTQPAARCSVYVIPSTAFERWLFWSRPGETQREYFDRTDPPPSVVRFHARGS